MIQANINEYTPLKSGSRWSDIDEIKSSTTRINIVSNDCPGGGFPLISDGRIAWVDNTDTHTLILGSTGSMKTRRGGMPLINIMAMAGESMVITDPKGELYENTSGLVAKCGHSIFVLNLRDYFKSDFWNPFDIPYSLYHSNHTKRDKAMEMLNDFLSAIAEPHRKGAKDPYFSELSYQLAFANVLLFIETAAKEEANIANFANFCISESTPDAIENITNHIEKGSIAHTNYKGILANKNATNTFGNVVAGVSAFINSFVIQRNLSKVLSQSSFDLRDIGKKKTAIYLIVPDEKTTLHFIITMFIRQLYEVLINEAQQYENGRLPVRVNFVLDEFANIPAIIDFPAKISAARSREIRFFLFVQSMRQLVSKYGEDAHTIKSNCDNWVFLTSREIDLLSEISFLCGDTAYMHLDGTAKMKPLISVSELQRFSKERGEALIIHGRQYPFVTELPDISRYKFERQPPLNRNESQLPKIVHYDAGKVIEEIRNGKRPVPFSYEVHDEDRTFKLSEIKSSNSTFIWD